MKKWGVEIGAVICMYVIRTVNEYIHILWKCRSRLLGLFAYLVLLIVVNSFELASLRIEPEHERNKN